MSTPIAKAEINPYLFDLQAKAIELDLAKKREWLALGHYRETGLTLDPQSQADSKNFFLSLQGKTNPLSELQATLTHFFESDTLGDQHAQCRFPARFFWLKKQLNIDVSLLPKPQCVAFSAWRNELNARSVTLIFPSAYLNSPSSMFGHTFLRLDQTSQDEQLDLLSYAVNYAADMNNSDDGEIMFAYKGLFGGYHGTTYVQPYYEKVKEYHDWENRDIWEYRLNLTQDQVDQLVRHVWEVKPINFDYFFFTENCSYRVLDYLEVANPNLNLLEQFTYRAIPADTVRAVEQSGLVLSVTYRPSAATELHFDLEQLSNSERHLVLALANGQIKTNDAQVSALSVARQAVVLQTAYAYVHYRQMRDELPQKEVAAIALPLLQARSQLKASALPVPPTPEVRPDQGHDTRKLTLSGGTTKGDTFSQIGMQMAYHGLLDPQPGYQRGAQLQFFSLQLRLYENQHAKVEEIKLIDIESLTPRDDFFDPLSWGVGVGASRDLVEKKQSLLSYGKAQAGVSYLVNNQLLSALLFNQLQVGEKLDENYRVGSGPAVSWQWQHQQHQGLLRYQWVDYWIGDRGAVQEVTYEQTYAFDKNLAISASVKQQHNEEITRWEVQGGIYVYF